MNAVDILGYVSTVLVVAAMLMGSVVRLRILNMAGAAGFGIYGVLVDSMPLVVTNGIIVGVHAWKLMLIARHRVDLAVVDAAGPDAPMVHRVLEVHGAEIARVNPDAQPLARPGLRVAYVLRDAALAGVFAWTEEAGTVRVVLDFVLPRDRDLSCAMLFLDHYHAEWTARGLTRVESPPGGQVHRDLRRGWGLLPPHRAPGGLAVAHPGR